MSDLVERLRKDCTDITSYECTEWRREAADEIARLRERVAELEYAKSDQSLLHDAEARIAHLERVVAAADDMRTWLEVNTIPAMLAREAYDAVRKGEG